jgi:hypothetical protein
MRASSRRTIVSVHKIFFSLLTLVGFAVAVSTVMIFVTTYQIREVAPFFLPTLAGFVSFSALLYNRARAYPEGAIQRRSLFAANEALNATILYLVALLVGTFVTFTIYGSGTAPQRREFSFEDPTILRALMLYWLPLLFMGLAYQSFSNALRIYSLEIVLVRRTRAALKRMRR